MQIRLHKVHWKAARPAISTCKDIYKDLGVIQAQSIEFG